jgi:transmembrane sensor
MQHITPELLKRYFNNQCTPEEKERIEAWLAESTPAQRNTDDVFTDIDKDALKGEIWNAVRPAAHSIRKTSRFGTALRVAASLLLIAAVTWVVYSVQHSMTQGSLTAESDYRVIRAAHGEKIRIVLADGTVVHLNAGSALSVPVQFADTARKVRLTGEAYLEVTKDPSRPFTVETEKATVRVLGTVFNVRAYAGENQTTVTVDEGRVRVSDTTGQHVLLTRNQRAVYVQSDQSLYMQNVNAANYTAWHKQILVFKDQPLAEIAVTLERWYNVSVEIRNSNLATHRFTGTFNNAALPVVMKDMSAVIQFHYELNEKKLLIY